MTNMNIVYEQLKNITDSMLFNGWQYVTKNDNRIILNKKYHELDIIDIQILDRDIHFSLPLKDSEYSFYNKFSCNDKHTIPFFYKYILHLTS